MNLLYFKEQFEGRYFPCGRMQILQVRFGRREACADAGQDMLRKSGPKDGFLEGTNCHPT